MLPRARPLCSSTSRHGTRRAQSNQAIRPQSFNSSRMKRVTQGRGSRKTMKPTIYIKAWDALSMPQTFSVVRELERTYGKIRMLHLPRDHDLSTAYYPTFWAEFRDDAVFERLPAESVVLTVEVPNFDETQPGGVGLDDLQGLLESVDYANGFAEQGKSLTPKLQEETEAAPNDKGGRQKRPLTKLVDIKVERSNRGIMHTTSGVYTGMSDNEIYKIGSAFMQWGGFYTPQAKTAKSADVDGEESTPSSEHMEAARAQWTQILRDRIPKPAVVGAPVEAQASEETSTQDEQSVRKTEEFPDVSINDLRKNIRAENIHAAAPTRAPSEAAQPPADPLPIEKAPTAAPSKPRPTRRERLLAQARENARTPLPASVLPPTPEEEAELAKEAEEAAKEKEQQQLTMREKLFKLMGW